MARLAALLLLAASWLTAAPRTRAGDDAAKFEGRFSNPVAIGAYKETWTIKKDGDKWLVTGIYNAKGKKPGSFMAKDIKFEDGKLTFIQVLRNADPIWINNCKITVTQIGDDLSYVWESGGTKGEPRTLKRLGK